MSDIETINTELALADLQTVEKQLARYRKVAKTGGDKEAQRLVAVLEKVLPVLDEAKPARTVDFSKEELFVLRPLFLLTMKPTLYVANVGEHGFHDNPLLAQVETHAAKEGAPWCRSAQRSRRRSPISLTRTRRCSSRTWAWKSPASTASSAQATRMLGLQTYFTAGPKEVRAWTVQVGATAPQAAGVIHTDFERGFIRAEVIPFDDYVANKGEVGAKEVGKMRVEGKEYVVHDGDVMHFRFNV